MNKTEFDKVGTHALHKYLGIEEIEASNGKAIIEIEVQEHILNPSETLHGGIIYTISDIVAFCALISQLEEGQIGVTNNFSIQMMRAVRLGQQVKFEANLTKIGKRLAFLEVVVTSSEKLIAKASITKTLIAYQPS